MQESFFLVAYLLFPGAEYPLQVRFLLPEQWWGSASQYKKPAWGCGYQQGAAAQDSLALWGYRSPHHHFPGICSGDRNGVTLLALSNRCIWQWQSPKRHYTLASVKAEWMEACSFMSLPLDSQASTERCITGLRRNGRLSHQAWAYSESCAYRFREKTEPMKDLSVRVLCSSSRPEMSLL